MVIKSEIILEQADIGVLGIDTRGCIQYANPMAKRLLNCAIPIGPPLKKIDPVLADVVISCMKEGKDKYRFNLNRQAGDTEILVSLVRDETDIGGAVCFMRKLEEVEAAAWTLPNIKEMNLQFQAVLDHSYYGIYILDGRGTVLKVNDVAADLIGLKKEAIIEIPPLRERREDIHNMSMFYLRKYNSIYKQDKRFSEKCIEELQTYDFPGNVRELKNIIKNAVVIKEDDELVKIIPAGRHKLKPDERSSSSIKPKHARGINEELFEFEHKKLEKALLKFNSTRDLADYLRISQSTVVRKLKKHGLSLE